MASSNDNLSMAVFCDFENVALGVRDANYEKFDIKPVLERLLLKGNIVVKKAYCDWERYKGFKATMHEANFELIEIPHVRQSGKNSADIRLVVDALDLCYTKSHVNTFVIISGDSDFSPLVSKLRENAKQVIGVGVKQSTSDLLIANCDEFIFYDDLVRESRRTAAKRDQRNSHDSRDTAPAARRTPEEDQRRKEEQEARKVQAIEMAVETFDALVSERGDSGKIWASLLKDAIKRRRPDFNESYYGFRTFGNLLEEAQTRGLLEFGRDDKSGAYVFRNHAAQAARAAAGETVSPMPNTEGAARTEPQEAGAVKHDPRRKSRGGRKQSPPAAQPAIEPAPSSMPSAEAVAAEPGVQDDGAAGTEIGEGNAGKPEPRRKSRGGRQPAARKAAIGDSAMAAPVADAGAAPLIAATAAPASEAAPAKKAAPRRSGQRQAEQRQAEQRQAEQIEPHQAEPGLGEVRKDEARKPAARRRPRKPTAEEA